MPNRHQKQRGLSAISYIIASAFLMIALSAALSITNSETSTNLEIKNMSNKILGQASTISVQINRCLSDYPGITNGDSVSSFFDTYPSHEIPTIVANPAELDSYMNLQDVECPGKRLAENNPGLSCDGVTDADECSAARLWAFTGYDTDFPIPPSGFSAWQYQNHPQWVALRLAAATDSGWPIKALQKLTASPYANVIRLCDQSDPPYMLYILGFTTGAVVSIDDIACE